MDEENRNRKIDEAIDSLVKSVRSELCSYYEKHPFSSEFPENFVLAVTENGVSAFADPSQEYRNLDELALSSTTGFSFESVEGVRTTPAIYQAMNELWNAVPRGVRSLDFSCKMVQYTGAGVKDHEHYLRVMGVQKRQAGESLMRAHLAVQDEGQELDRWMAFDLTNSGMRMIVPAADEEGAARKAAAVMSSSDPWPSMSTMRLARVSTISMLALIKDPETENSLEM